MVKIPKIDQRNQGHSEILRRKTLYISCFKYIKDQCPYCRCPAGKGIDGGLHMSSRAGVLSKTLPRFWPTTTMVVAHPDCIRIQGCGGGPLGGALIPRSEGWLDSCSKRSTPQCQGQHQHHHITLLYPYVRLYPCRPPWQQPAELLPSRLSPCMPPNLSPPWSSPTPSLDILSSACP